MVTKVAKKGEIRYKPYHQDLIIHLPVLLEDVVKENVLVQIVNEIVNKIDISELAVYYSGIGCPPYYPLMLIKVWVYGFCNKIYTSRPLARKLREDLCFMWLAGGQKPCFKTLSEFRGTRMQGMIEVIFKEVLYYLLENGYIDLADLYVDGSKWEANANKHKITWRKNTERYKQAVEERITELLKELSCLQREEDEKYGHKDIKGMGSASEVKIVLDSESLHQRIQQVNELVAQEADKQNQRKLKSIANKLTKETEKIEKYEKQEKILGNRNSYSKTDEAATGMRMKDDLLKPGYNPQITSSNQFIVNATIHQNSSDSVTFPSHVEKMEERAAGLVDSTWCPAWTTDAGYGSEGNYELLEQKGMIGYVKYPSWYAEHTGEIKKKVYNKYNWCYDQAGDFFLCPEGKKLQFLEWSERTNRNGYQQHFKIYECESCLNCPVFEKCRGERASKKTNRRIHINERLEEHKQKAKELLLTEKGKEQRSNRATEVETPFGNIKYNLGHRRFILRGLEKVNIEFLLLAIAHNLRKVYCKITGVWEDYYAQRAAKSKKNKKKGR